MKTKSNTYIYSIIDTAKLFGFVAVSPCFLFSASVGASSSHDYQVLEDNFSAVHTDGSSQDFIEEAGLTDMQYISQGTDTQIQPQVSPVSYPEPVKTGTPTPTPFSRSSSHHGGGGSNPLIVRQLANRNTTLFAENTTTKQKEEHSDQTVDPPDNGYMVDNEITQKKGPHKVASGPYINTDRNSSITHNQEKEEENTRDNQQFQKYQKKFSPYSSENMLADDYFYKGPLDGIDHKNLENTEIKKEERKKRDMNDAGIENSEFHSAAPIQTYPIACESSLFRKYTLLLIFFLLGMIVQAIVHKIFYSNKNDI